MKIAAIVPAYTNALVVNDTLDSIRKYMTDDILVLTDGYMCNDDICQINGQVLSGFRQGGSQGSHLNRIFGLINLLSLYPHADWYCWIEYDAIVVSDAFKQDLETDCSMVGFSVENKVFDISVLPSIFRKRDLKHLVYMLGSVMFHHGDFIRQLHRDGMFEWLIAIIIPFQSCHKQKTVNQLPGLTLKNQMYDLGEYLMGTLADCYGKGVKSLSHWDQRWLKWLEYDDSHWSGNYQRYPIRFFPTLDKNLFTDEASIMHPVKDYNDPIRQQARYVRSLR